MNGGWGGGRSNGRQSEQIDPDRLDSPNDCDKEHDASGVTETQFYLPDSFSTRESAIEAAIRAGRQKIDVGFERGSEVVKG